MFTLYKAHGPLKVEGYDKELYGWERKLTVNSRLEQVKIVVIGKTSTRESVL